jgi:hypothetical protein
VGSDDYKVDPRQPVEDFQVAFEIEELRRSVDKIAEELQQLETTNGLLRQLGNGVAVLLFLILLCVAGILAKMMNWL